MFKEIKCGLATHIFLVLFNVIIKKRCVTTKYLGFIYKQKICNYPKPMRNLKRIKIELGGLCYVTL